jgi:IS1 family transposase
VWSYCYAKAKNVPAHLKGRHGVGDVWTWTALDADTKLVITWAVGGREAGTAHTFIQDLADRLANRVQLTTDGHKVYLEAVEGAFAGAIDYSMLVKLYGAERAGEARYSLAKCIGCVQEPKVGNPDPAHISTSHVERQNLTMRMGMRRFTRLTNAFSKKFENHCHAINLFFLYFNFARIHQTLRITPAMAAGVADHVWSLEEIVALLGS